MKPWGEEDGQVLPLVIGLALVAMAVAGLAVDGTRAFLDRRSLQSRADAAVLAAASEIDRDAYYATGGAVVALDPASARQVALSWLEGSSLRGTASVAAGSDGVMVRLRAETATTFLRLVGVRTIPVAVEAAALPEAGGAP